MASDSHASDPQKSVPQTADPQKPDQQQSERPSSDQPSAFVEPLPARPSLEMQQKRAKELLRAIAAGDPAAQRRLRALHPKPPPHDELKLADAQLVIARGYGFESWPAMRAKIEALTRPPVQRFADAIRAGDIEQVRALLAEHAEVRAAVNAPIGYFGARPAGMAKKNLPMLDLLLQHGADLNLKSDWWAGPFGLMDFDCTPEEAAPLIARGAVVDIFAAAHLGMFDRVKALVDQDSSVVHGRGGDGKTALHSARTVEIARYLLDHGAAIDARDVDHESTAAQYLVREAPEVTRLLVARGAWVDIFMAVGLRDAALVERCLREDPAALDHRTWHGLYTVAHQGRPATSEEIGNRRGDTYRWVFGHNVSALDVAADLGFDDVADLLLRHASPAQRLLAACAQGDRAAAEAVVAAHPEVVAALTPEQMELLPYAAHANKTAAVTLMVDLGFDTHVRGTDEFEAIRWAAFHGNAEMMRLLLRHDPPIGVKDPSYGGTPLGQCLYGSLHGWHRATGDFATTVQLLLDAGEQVDPAQIPIGRDDVDDVLRAHLKARER